MAFILLFLGCNGNSTYGEDGVYSCTFTNKDAEVESCNCEPESVAGSGVCCDRLCDDDPDPGACTTVCNE